MYITYETAQNSWNDEYGYAKRAKPPITIPNDLPKTDFMPTKLVRISDMKVVDGSQVNEGYCALSYSWNQSGDILIDGKTEKINESMKPNTRLFLMTIFILIWLFLNARHTLIVNWTRYIKF
ncbi:hypothetical protein BDA99DRAFT_534011 [Phascolomyces articulosus]|uniref:Uncharacterized protein n=1 Tax=Phascolomyces articulosus TaxID=60185 RepID=A0AAD5PII3_9FUNG|nr:hypothetical protein BDA99DRAFT_534011 [Phascolomyces articulosus]